MSSHKGTIICGHPDFVVPKAYWELVFAEKPNVYSITAADDKSLVLERTKSMITLDGVMEMEESFKSLRRVWYFGQYPTGFIDDDIQPYTLLSVADKPAIVGFFDGGCPTFHKDKSAHSDAFFFANNMLIPRVHQLSRLVSNDVDKIMAELKDPVTATEFTSAMVNRGELVLVSVGGRTVTHQMKNDDLGREYPWGFVSNHLGFSTHTEEVKTPAEHKPMSHIEELRQKLALKGKPVEAQSGMAQMENKAGLSSELKSGTTAAPSLVGATMVGPPPEQTRKSGKHAVKAWYKQNAGYCPQDYMKFPVVASTLKKHAEVPKETATNTVLADKLKAAQEKAPVTPEPAKPAEQPVDPKKDVEPAHITPTGNLPILSAAQKQALAATMAEPSFQGMIDRHSATLIANPLRFKELEAKLPSFAESAGLKSMAEVLHWPPEAFDELIEKGHKEAIKLLIHDCIKLYLQTFALGDVKGSKAA